MTRAIKAERVIGDGELISSFSPLHSPRHVLWLNVSWHLSLQDVLSLQQLLPVHQVVLPNLVESRVVDILGQHLEDG